MQFFIDSADINEIKQAKALGILSGVTTNPSLVARVKLHHKKKFKEIIEEICQEVNVPVSVEVLKIDEGMIAEGEELANIAKNIVVKLPCTQEGLKACHELSNKGISTNLTLCFSLCQALLVANAGATFVSPFIGRLDDVGEDGLSLIANIKLVYNNYGIATKVLGASVRNSLHIFQCARIGCDIVTVPFSVIKNLMHHDLTEKGLAIFLEDARKASGYAGE